ncbi:MAG: hypothetical protein ABI910_04630 [Gemmatimonadota bacterium]
MMTRSPILWLSAAQALARCKEGRAATVRRATLPWTAADASARFVQLAGYRSHFAAEISSPSGPSPRTRRSASCASSSMRRLS